MSFLIRGIEIPQDGHWSTVSGALFIHGNGDVSDKKGRTVGKVIYIPPHGRLGDLDAIRRLLFHSLSDPDVTSPTIRGLMKTIISAIDSFPTIIPAGPAEVGDNAL